MIIITIHDVFIKNYVNNYMNKMRYHHIKCLVSLGLKKIFQAQCIMFGVHFNEFLSAVCHVMAQIEQYLLLGNHTTAIA